MGIDTETLTRADVAWLVGMSDSWVRDRMQAGDLPRPGATAEEYVEAFVAANTARGEASSALQREAVMVANEQMRALSPADRVVLSQIAVSASQPPRQPAKSQPKR